MNTVIRELTVEEKSSAMIAPKAEAIRVGDDDLFAPVAPRKPVKPFALGTTLAGKPIVIKSVAVTELDAMSADLAKLQAGLVEPVVRLTSEQLDEIESERPGEDFSTQPFLY